MKLQDKKSKASIEAAEALAAAESARTHSPRASERSGAVRAIAADELDPGRERRPLESYFQEIGGTRTLRREEEVILAKELESATAELRDALYAIPCSARHVVARRDALRALSHTGAKLSESAGDEETGEIAARVEKAVGRLRRELRRRDALTSQRSARAAQLARVDRAIAREMHAAQLSLAMLAELREQTRRMARELRLGRR
ncbi:MAG TPA: sigma-70 factor domain-containing protein, partial [Myxococcota bacterium]|nr:sigma-70 factor domain-containing protein [Myxococcota bacterium]